MPTLELEIFRAGDYPQGRFTVEDLYRIAADYDPAWHEAPACVTHEGDPRENLSAEAYGWVRRLWVDGDRLFAEVADVPDDFVAAVRAGRYRKRSAGFYTALPRPDGSTGPYLRHLAWVPIPQVKGMADPVLPPARGAMAMLPALAFVEPFPSVTSQEDPVMQEPTPTPTVPPEAAPQPVPAPPSHPAEGADRRSARVEGLRAFFAEMIAAGRLTPAQAEVEGRTLERIAAAADFAEADAALLEAKRREIAARPPTGLLSRGAAPSAARTPDDELRRRVALDFAEHFAVYRRLGVREESLLALARAESGRA
jgi:hypothetical protein